jgi:negative regulator of sigma E activity
MRQTPSDVNTNHAAGRKTRHAYTFAAGVVAVAIAAVVVVEERSASALADRADAGVALHTGAVMENSGPSASTLPSSDTARPRFQRSEEPANDDDPANPHGG